MPDKEDVAHAVAFALLAKEVAELTAAQKETDKKIQDLLSAWNASRWILNSIATLAGIAAAIAAAIGAYRGIFK